MAMLFSELFSGGGKSRLVRSYQIHSGVSAFVAPAKGKLLILEIAGGASGGAGFNSTATPIIATGGGAGEWVTDVVDVSPGDSFAIFVGLGGAATSIGAPGAANGTDGGSTSITGPNGYSLIANGGIKGLCTIGAQSQTGGAGGNGGSGGTAKARRSPGGRGGNCTGTATAGTLIRLATGGGGVNTRGTSVQTTTRGGDMVALTVTGGMGTGGGSAGYRGGDITSASASLFTGGAGYGGSGVTNSATAGPNALGVAATASPADILASLAVFGINYFGGGGTTAGPGGGQNSSTNPSAGSPGVMGGGGAAANAVTSANSCSQGQQLGGGGAGASMNANAGPVNSGKGGDGIVITIFCEDI